MTGLVNGVATTGTLTITQFARQAGQLVALGTLTLGGVDLGQVTVPVTAGRHGRSEPRQPLRSCTWTSARWT